MVTIPTAIQVVQQAEDRLAGLIGDAVRGAAFADAKMLVDAAATLAAVRAQLSREAPLPEGLTGGAGPVRVTERAGLGVDEGQGVHRRRIDRSPAVRKPATEDYPRFERDGNRLVKIGWSAKDKQTYEHRVTREIVNAVSEYIAQKVRPRRLFKMEKLLPIPAADGSEIPSYKAYLVIKWLQQYEAIQRKGKDGYVLGDSAIDADALTKLWNRTPDRADTQRRDAIPTGVSANG